MKQASDFYHVPAPGDPVYLVEILQADGTVRTYDFRRDLAEARTIAARLRCHGQDARVRTTTHRIPVPERT